MSVSGFAAVPGAGHGSLSGHNVTGSVERSEILPAFVNWGHQIVFLVFDGDTFNPKPWDYRLAISDRRGHHVKMLTGSGVIEYAVAKDDNKVRILTRLDDRELTLSDEDLLHELTEWQLREISLETGKNRLIASANGRPLLVGYEMLRPERTVDERHYRTKWQSPFARDNVVVQRFAQGEENFVRWDHITPSGGVEELFVSHAWNSYGHIGWSPPVVWLDADHVVTLAFNSREDAKLPQSEGLFSILVIDLKTKHVDTILYDAGIYPFSQLTVHPFEACVYFQKINANTGYRELWQLHLETREARKLYASTGEFGGIRVSKDGGSLVFTQLIDDNFDIVRLDLPDGNRLRFAAN